MQSPSHFLLDFSVLALCVRQQRPQWGLLSSADTVVSPSDAQRLPVDKTRCDLAPCAFVNLLHSRAGNVHLCGTLLVGLLLQVNQPNDLVFVQRQQDRLGILAPVGAEGINLWCTTNPTARGSLSIDPLFLLHIDYSALDRKNQYSFQKSLQSPSLYASSHRSVKGVTFPYTAA